MSLSDYPDQVFNFEKEEVKMNKMIKDIYANLNFRGAFVPFLHITAEDNIRQMKKLPMKLLREFAN